MGEHSRTSLDLKLDGHKLHINKTLGCENVSKMPKYSSVVQKIPSPYMKTVAVIKASVYLFKSTETTKQIVW